eukprot:c18514_g1_i1.p1 GENE.c18514_g1_i1~~c18514_g1_i1.p1  ORF type:complete len:292 (+),score=82.89 c18514_g1_i1:48-923(+)
MCWVQRKPFAGPDLGDDRIRLLKARATHLESYIKAKEEELTVLGVQMEEVEKALKARLALLESSLATDKKTRVEGREKQAQVEREQKDEQERQAAEEAKDPVTTAYLKSRPGAKEFRDMLDHAEDDRIDKLKAGIKVMQYSGAKSGAFGRKKKAKKTEVWLILSEDEDVIQWGPNKDQPKTLTSYNVDKVSVRFGKSSELFSSGIEDPAWVCFTITTSEAGKAKEFDFVCEDANNLSIAVTVLDALGVAPESQPRITKGRFLWMRAYMLAAADSNRMAELLAKGVVESDEE